MIRKPNPGFLYTETGQDNDDIVVPPLEVMKRQEFKSANYLEVKQYNDGDIAEWMEALHAVRVALGQNDEGKTARPIRVGELVGLTRHAHQGRHFKPFAKQEIINFGYYEGIHGKKTQFGPIWHKVRTFGDRVILVQFDYILTLSHRRFFYCGNHLFEIVGGKEVIRKIYPYKAMRQIANALDMVWHANNPPPDGVVIGPGYDDGEGEFTPLKIGEE